MAITNGDIETEVWLVAEYGEITAAHSEGLTSAPWDVKDDVEKLVALLGDGYTYHGELRIDVDGQPPTRIRVVRRPTAGATPTGGWEVVQEDGEVVYPAEYAIPDGPAVVFDPQAARAWLSEVLEGGMTRGSAYYNVQADGMYEPVNDDSPGDWLERIIPDLALTTTPVAPHVWRSAPGVTVDVIETVGPERHSDGRAVLVVEVGGLRLASQWLEASDLATYDTNAKGEANVPHVEAAVQALTRAAEVINRMVEDHRQVRVTDAAARSVWDIGPLAGQLGAGDIECALHTLAEIIRGVHDIDPHDTLSERQRAVAARVNRLYEGLLAVEADDDEPRVPKEADDDQSCPVDRPASEGAIADEG